jgi:four helix bundle protein
MFSFQKLDVYKLALETNGYIYSLLERLKIPGYIKSQLGRASLSIQLNIAEGSGRLTDKDRKNFYVTSRASCFECVSIIQLLSIKNKIQQEEFNSLFTLFERISQMLFAMIRRLE